METEILFTASKWGILKQISKNASSPLEIAKKLGTTIANVSQQMRLLEASGLVAKKKVPSSKPGKPRALFSLTGNFAFLTILSTGKAQKELLRISKEQQFQLNLWLFGNNKIVGPLTKFYYNNEEIFKKISELSLKNVSGKTITLEKSRSEDHKNITKTEKNRKTENITKHKISYDDETYTIILQNSSNSNNNYILIKEVPRL